MPMKKIRASKLTSLAALVAIALGSTAYATQYTVTPIGTLGGTTTIVNGINSTGELVGWSLNNAGNTLAFLYNNGSMQSLGSLQTGGYSDATAINSAGQIVGYGSDNGYTTPFLFNNGSMQALPTFYGPSGQATGINSSGEIVGYTYDPNISSNASWVNSNGTSIDSRSGIVSTGINSSGAYVGIDSSNLAFLETGTSYQLLYMGQYSGAMGINSLGQVVGYGGPSSLSYQPFLWNPSGLSQYLGTLGGANGSANAINSTGQVVGWADNSAGSQNAFLYSNGVMQNLNNLLGSASSEYTLTNAVGINKNGQIAVNGTITATGQSMGFLLTPMTSASSTGVPAPATLGLLAAAMAGLLILRRKQARSFG